MFQWKKCSLGYFIRQQSHGAWQSLFPQPDPSADHYFNPAPPENSVFLLVLLFALVSVYSIVAEGCNLARQSLLLTLCVCSHMCVHMCITGKKVSLLPCHRHKADLSSGMEFVVSWAFWREQMLISDNMIQHQHKPLIWQKICYFLCIICAKISNNYFWKICLSTRIWGERWGGFLLENILNIFKLGVTVWCPWPPAQYLQQLEILP